MKAKQHYDCFPEYIYNTAFGSLLTGLNGINPTIGIDGDELVANNELYSGNLFGKIPWKIDDHNSKQQTLQDIIKILVDFLDEFLLFLSSIIECEKFQPQFQLQKMIDVAELIYQVRLTLLMQINNIHEHMTNTTIFDIPSISLILHELASVIHYLSKEQQQTAITIKHSQTLIFSQSLNRLEKIIKSCMDRVSMHSNPQSLESSTSVMVPCNGSNMCMPWSILEQMKNSSGTDPIFGLMYGIKDENIRRKLGYRVAEHQTSNVENNRKSGRILTNSIKSQKENPRNRLGGGRTTSRKESIIHSKQSSPLFNSKSDTDESIRLRYIHVSNSTGRRTPHPTSLHTEELPITSMADHSESQRTSSRLIQQQQSNIYKEDNSQSTLSSPVSLQTYGYRTPSKTTYKVSRESSQSLSPIHNKSINTQQSRESILSRKNSSINDFEETKSTSSVARNDDQQNPISYQTHIDNVDSSVTLTSNDKTQHSESISNKSWEQRLASPLSMTSVQRSHSTHLKQNIISPISNKQRSINETTSDFNFDKYSEHQMSPSKNFLIETTDNISSLNVIEGPQSAEGEEKPLNTSHHNKKYMSTPQFSPIDIHRQRSTNLTKEKQDKFYRQKPTTIPLQLDKQGYLNKFMNCFRQTIANRVDQLNYKNK